MAADKPHETIVKYFDYEDHGKVWHLFCKKCNKGWSLKKGESADAVHPGNVLHLLNHARSHDKSIEKIPVKFA